MSIQIPRLSPLREMIPSLAFALFCAAIPLVGNDLPDFTRYILIALPALAIMHALIAHGPLPIVRPYDVAAMLFGLMAFVSLTYAVSQRTAEISLAWLGVCLAAYLLARYMAVPSCLDLVAKVLIWAVCATVLDQIFFLVIQGTADYPRIFSTFLNKNVYGGVLASTLPLVFLADTHSSTGRAILKAVYGSIIVAGLILTFSKGAWLVALAAIVAIIALNLARRDYRSVAATGLAVLLGITTGFGLDLLANRQAIGSMARPTARNVNLIMTRSVIPRLEYWRNALVIAETAPIIGTGYGTFADTHTRVARWPIYSKSTHSFPLQTLTELGGVGLALFLFVIGSSAVPVLKNLSEHDGDQSGRFPFYLAAMVILGHSCLDFTMNVPEGALWFWLLLGIGSPRAVFARCRERARQYLVPMAAGLAGLILLGSAGVLYERQASITRLIQAAAASEPGYKVNMFSRALKIRKSDDVLLAGRAAAYWGMGQLEHARDDLRAAIRANAYKPAYYLNLATIALVIGNKEEARHLAEQAITFNPTLPEILEGYGKVLVQTGDPRGGAAAIARAILRRGADACSLPLESVRELLASCTNVPGQPGGTIRLALAVVEYRLGRYEQSYKVLPVWGTLPEEDKDIMSRLVAALRDQGCTGEP